MAEYSGRFDGDLTALVVNSTVMAIDWTVIQFDGGDGGRFDSTVVTADNLDWWWIDLVDELIRSTV